MGSEGLATAEEPLETTDDAMNTPVSMAVVASEASSLLYLNIANVPRCMRFPYLHSLRRPAGAKGSQRQGDVAVRLERSSNRKG